LPANLDMMLPSVCIPGSRAPGLPSLGCESGYAKSIDNPAESHKINSEGEWDGPVQRIERLHRRG
jgi:hypothetical protein